MLARFLLRVSSLLTAVLIFTGLNRAAEQSTNAFGWQKELVGDLNFVQNQLDNWKEGGEDSWSWLMDINGNLINNRPHFKWSSSGKISFGQTKLGTDNTRKAADELKIESVYLYKLGVFVNPSVSFSGQTQIAPGYRYSDTSRVIVSDFMDPGYFRQSIGLGYDPNGQIKTRLGAAIKETFTHDFPAPYADDPQTGKIEKIKIEPGMESVTDLHLKFRENVLFNSKLELFTDFGGFRNVDVDWQNRLNMKISEYIGISLNIRIYYDSDISRRRQYKQILGINLSYSFF